MALMAQSRAWKLPLLLNVTNLELTSRLFKAFRGRFGCKLTVLCVKEFPYSNKLKSKRYRKIYKTRLGKLCFSLWMAAHTLNGSFMTRDRVWQKKKKKSA